MDPLPPTTRRANRVLFIALVIFAVALAVACFVWMRGVVKANGGIVDPQRSTSVHFRSRERVVGVDFVLPSAAGEGRSQKAEGRSPARDRRDSRPPSAFAFAFL